MPTATTITVATMLELLLWLIIIMLVTMEVASVGNVLCDAKNKMKWSERNSSLRLVIICLVDLFFVCLSSLHCIVLCSFFLLQVRSGDCLQVVDAAGNVSFSPVICLAEFQGRFALLVLPFSRLALTPTHPLRIQGSFVRPCDMSFPMNDDPAADHTEMPTSLIVDRVFNVVLQHSHVLLCINGMEAVTLGHGFMQAFHPFYSTKQVLTTLEQRPGWKEGHVIVAPHHPLRKQHEC